MVMETGPQSGQLDPDEEMRFFGLDPSDQDDRETWARETEGGLPSSEAADEHQYDRDRFEFGPDHEPPIE